MASDSDNSCMLKVRIQPRASRNQVDGFEEDTLRIRVSSSPTEGQANDGVVALLAKTLGVSKSRLEIVRGHSSRNKLVSVETLSEQEVRRRIESGLKES